MFEEQTICPDLYTPDVIHRLFPTQSKIYYQSNKFKSLNKFQIDQERISEIFSQCVCQLLNDLSNLQKMGYYYESLTEKDIVYYKENFYLWNFEKLKVFELKYPLNSSALQDLGIILLQKFFEMRVETDPREFCLASLNTEDCQLIQPLFSGNTAVKTHQDVVVWSPPEVSGRPFSEPRFEFKILSSRFKEMANLITAHPGYDLKTISLFIYLVFRLADKIGDTDLANLLTLANYYYFPEIYRDCEFINEVERLIIYLGYVIGYNYIWENYTTNKIQKMVKLIVYNEPQLFIELFEVSALPKVSHSYNPNIMHLDLKYISTLDQLIEAFNSSTINETKKQSKDFFIDYISKFIKSVNNFYLERDNLSNLELPEPYAESLHQYYTSVYVYNAMRYMDLDDFEEFSNFLSPYEAQYKSYIWIDRWVFSYFINENIEDIQYIQNMHSNPLLISKDGTDYLVENEEIAQYIMDDEHF